VPALTVDAPRRSTSRWRAGIADRGLDDDEDVDAGDLDPTTTWGRRCKSARTNHWWECGELHR
jgi:hypothetical protein